MLTNGTTEEVTLIVIAFEFAAVGEAHGSLDVRTQETTSAFVKALFEYVTLLVPTLFPFNFH